MRKPLKILSLTIVGSLVLALGGVTFAKNMDIFQNKELVLLEKEKQRFMAENKPVPEELSKKIEVEKRQNEILQQVWERRKQEIAEIQNERLSAPKDGKGNPLLPDRSPALVKAEPREEVGIIRGKDYAKTFFPPFEAKNLDFSSTITAPYNVLIAGSENGNPNNTFIVNVITYKEGGGGTRERYDFVGKARIVFDGLEKGNQIVLFQYGDGEKGYFDLNTNVAYFEPYQAK